MTNYIFLFTTLSLCCLYFVVTGIQFWMTAYCIKVLDADPGLVTIVYSLVSITAPIPGAAMGGYLADKNVRLILTFDFREAIKGRMCSLPSNCAPGSEP